MRNRLRPTGFNFVEVLFAVMILGIGFIMIAAIFPVALQQTKQTGEEVTASTSSRGGVNFMQQIGLLPNNALPLTVQTAAPQAIPAGKSITLPGSVFSFRDDRLDPVIRDQLWNQISGNLILPSDPSTAWVALFRRGATYTDRTNALGSTHVTASPAVDTSPLPYAQVFVISVQSRNRSNYDARDLQRHPNNGPGGGASTTTGTLEPLPVLVKLTEGVSAADQLQFVNGAGAAFEVQAAAEGAFVIISDDQYAGTDNAATTRMIESNGMANGRIYRLGTKIGTGLWELAPGWDMDFQAGGAGVADDINENIPTRAVGAAATGSPAVAFIVGKGYADPTNPLNGYEGVTQDVAVYTSFVPAN